MGLKRRKLNQIPLPSLCSKLYSCPKCTKRFEAPRISRRAQVSNGIPAYKPTNRAVNRFFSKTRQAITHNARLTRARISATEAFKVNPAFITTTNSTTLKKLSMNMI